MQLQVASVHPGLPAPSLQGLLPRWMAIANPAVLVVLLALLSLFFPAHTTTLSNAAPNQAHVVYFALFSLARSHPEP